MNLNFYSTKRREKGSVRGMSLLFLLTVLSFFGKLNAQTFYTIGTGTTTTTSTQYSIYGTLYEDGRKVYRYNASEFQALGAGSGNITSVAFNVSSIGSPTPSNVNIKIGFTSSTAALSGFPTGMTTVYSSASVTPTTGWNTYNFSTPVFWNGSDNVLIEICFDNTSWSSNYGNYYTLSTGSSYGLYLDGTTGCSMTSGNGGAHDYRANAKFGISPSGPNDAGVSGITSPSMPSCAGTYPVTATINNYGTNQISPVAVGWSINGVAQTGTNYTGTLDVIGGTGSNTASVALGNVTVSSTPTALKIWTSQPNNVADPVNINDTLNITLAASLSGTYTIGSNGDFANFTAAVDALNNYGVCGATVFHVQDSTFTEQIVLNSVGGSSSTNTIKFMTNPTATGMATLQYIGTAANYATFKFNGAQYVTLENLEISGIGGSYGRAIEFAGNNDHITVKDCDLNVPITTSSLFAVIYNNSGGSMTENCLIDNCTMSGGYYSAYWYGNSTAILEQNNTFSNNTMTNFYYYGLMGYYQNNFVVENNYLENSGASTITYMTYRYYVDGASHFRGNTIINKSGGYVGYWLYNDASSANPAIIANNFFLSTNSSYTSTNYGIYNYYTSYQKFYHNNYYHNGASATYQAMRLYASSSAYAGNEFKNNIVSAVSTAQPIYFYQSGTTIASDYNDYYYPNTTIGYYNTNYTTLAAMQTGASTDANSLNVDPNYTNPSIGDLHQFQIALDGAATNVGITVDIDGQTRPIPSDIGADERVFPLNDVTPGNLISPSNPFCSDSAQVEVAIMNAGQLNLTSASVHYSVNGSTTSTYNWTGNLTPASMDTVVFAATGFNNGDLLKVWTSSPNNLLDSNAAADTIYLTILNGLTGAYNIPGDFASISNAVDTLNMIGTCDTVWFNIAAGTYDEPVSISQFARNIADAPVIFRSADGDSADVIWQTTTTGNVINLQGADYIWFEDLTIKNANTSGVNAVVIGGGANYNKFERNHIVGVPINTTSTTNATIYDGSGRDDYNSYIDNMIENGSMGLYLYGVGTTDLEQGTVLDGNIIRNFYYMGTYCYYNNEMTITNNEVYTNSIYTSPYGMYHYYANGYMTFSGNHIHYVEGSNGFLYGAYFSSCVGASPFNRGDFSNNIIVAGRPGQTATNYGMYFTTASMKNVYNNTLVMLDGSTSSTPMYIAAGDGNEYINNIFAVIKTDTSASYQYGKGYAMYYGSGILINSDYNDFYTEGTTPVYYMGTYTSLSSYQSASMNDMHSLAVNPQFVDTINAFLCNPDLDGAAMVTYLTSDFAGNQRNPNTPDIGAREYQSIANFSIGPDTTICDVQTTLYVGAGATSITWQDANSTVIGNSTSLEVSQNTAFPVSVAYTNYCGSASDAITLGFVSNVSLDSALHLCAGESENLVPDGNGNPNALYSWFPGGQATAQINVNSAGIYTVNKSQEGCNSSASIYVTQSQGVTLADAEICADNVPFSVDATIIDGVSYNWNGGSSMNTAANDFTTSGSYSVTASDVFGCVATDTFELLVIDVPTAVISNDSHSSNLFYLSSILSQNVGSNASYFWNFGDGSTSTDANPMHLFPWNGQPQTFTVTLTIINDCGTSETVSMDITSDPLGVNSIAVNALNIYPNPSTGLVTISGINASGQCAIEVYDLGGRLVLSNSAAANGNIQVDLQGLASGSYQIKVISSEATSVGKVIIQ